MICKYCGAQLSPNRNRCLNCKRTVTVIKGDHTARFGPRDIRRHRVISAFSYLSFLVLLPLLFARRSHFARFHANQGLVLLLLSTSYTLATRIFVRILELLFSSEYASVAATLSNIFGLGGILFFVLAVVGAIHALRGHAKELPLIGRIRFLF